MNWRGHPLTGDEVVVNLIGSATTRAGLKVRAELDRSSYPLGRKIADHQLAAVDMTPQVPPGMELHNRRPSTDT